MNIILYGVPTATAEKIAARYGLRTVNSPDKFDASWTVLAVPPISAPRYLFAFYKAMIRHEAKVDAVIVCGAESCPAVSTIRYSAPPEKFFTLSGGADGEDGTEGEDLLGELCELLDALFDEGNRINV